MASTSAPAKPATVFTHQMILENSLAHLPGFSARGDQELLLMILTTYIGTDDFPVAVQLGPKMALRNLITFKKLTAREDIDTAHMNVMKALAASMSGVYASFEAVTGSKLDRKNFDAFEEEFLRESDEQETYSAKAEKVLDRVRVACGQIGMANPDPALKVAGPASVVKRANPLAGIGRSIRTAFVADVAPKKGMTSVSNARVGWTTPPVLGKRYAELEDFLKTIEDYTAEMEKAKKVNAKLDVAKGTMDFMKAQGFDDKFILAQLTELATIARAQISQSVEILTNITPDYESVKEAVLAVNNIKTTADAVKAYFA